MASQGKKLFAVEQTYDTGFGGKADMSRILLIWALSSEEAITKAREWERGSDDPEKYSYEAEEVDLEKEEQSFFYHNNY